MDRTPLSPPEAPPGRSGLAVALSGGGARAAYQVGVLRALARRWPRLHPPILTGISAGAVNSAHLAAHHGTFLQAVEELAGLWAELTPERVFRVDVRSLAKGLGIWGTGLLSGGHEGGSRLRGLVETEPLRRFLTGALAPVEGELTGIDYNLHRGTLDATALGTTSYTTGQTVMWVQGREIEGWERPGRVAVPARLTVEHVMASAALPFLFPAVRIGDHWYGDGGIRLTAPLSPALHLGAEKILAIALRYPRTRAEADVPEVVGYPPPAQIAGVLMNSVFLDLVDQDVLRMEQFNRLVDRLPEGKRDGLRHVDLLVIRPSRDLGMLAGDYEPRLPRAFRWLSRGLGTRRTTSPDLLSMIMFQPDYLARLMELGEADAEAQMDRIAAFLEPGPDGACRGPGRS